ncbi:MAG: hypothetical protein U5R31_04655 [Acidimicrobiia bacterium]|nr:hypothetical protein [Acidimicrobiia bacterium]
MGLDLRRPGVVAVLAAAFVVLRLGAVVVAENADVYGTTIDPTSDVVIYEGWGEAVHTEGAAPYGDVAIEYPPGAIPFLVAPAVGADHVLSYFTDFVLLMAAVDAVGFVALIVMARRGSSPAGVVAWIVFPCCSDRCSTAASTSCPRWR